MGCLNSNQNFSHWFGNIHFSGPCNRSCYFCIGQHMMALDPLNNLDQWPLKGIDHFIESCNDKGISEINLTGTNTDPMLYKHILLLKNYLRRHLVLPLVLGVRTNGALLHRRSRDWSNFDKGSISVPSLDPVVYKMIMGKPGVPDLLWIARHTRFPLKVNIVLCPEITPEDLLQTFDKIAAINDAVKDIGKAGFSAINLREPYGQPHLGNPMMKVLLSSAYIKDAWTFPIMESKDVFGMPSYSYRDIKITYWDVHYCEVESVNLYANGKVSLDYPITRGHDEQGTVLDQRNFLTSGRIREQWIGSNQ